MLRRGQDALDGQFEAIARYVPNKAERRPLFGEMVLSRPEPDQHIRAVHKAVLRAGDIKQS